MTPDSRVYVAGHRGMVGSALLRALVSNGYGNILTRSHDELDLIDGAAVSRFFDRERPHVVLLAAAKVGGIRANDAFPADFVRDNLAIQTNVIHAAWRAGVEQLLFLGSSCMYPRDCSQPIKEEYLLTGPPEVTNRSYAIAKIAGLEMCSAYNRQHGTRFVCVVPASVYGPGDNYDLESGHVFAALIRKFHEARVHGNKVTVLWGTGAPRREFIHADDLAAACKYLLELPHERLAAFPQPLVNVGMGSDLTVADLAHRIAAIVGSDCKIEWDTTKPDGTPQKLLDVSRLDALGWRPTIGLDEGIRHAYRDFLMSRPTAAVDPPN